MDNWVALIHTAEAYLKDINVTTTLAPTMNLHKTASLANQLCAHSHKSYGEKIVNIISFALHVSYIITVGTNYMLHQLIMSPSYTDRTTRYSKHRFNSKGPSRVSSYPNLLILLICC